jgi:hypothetical protein
MEERPPANMWNKQSRTVDREWFSSLGEFGEVLTTPDRKTQNVTEHLSRPWTWD